LLKPAKHVRSPALEEQVGHEEEVVVEAEAAEGLWPAMMSDLPRRRRRPLPLGGSMGRGSIPQQVFLRVPV
jgi:hypothetical protein